MRVLVALVHYFKGDAQSPWHSTNESRREARTALVGAVVQGWRGQFGPNTTIDIETRSFQHGPGSGDQVDLALVTVPGCSLLDEDFCRRWDVTRFEHQPANPRMLGFHAHELFAQHASAYDLFCWSEDDLLPTDPDFLAKLAYFTHKFGSERVLSPNRYEWAAQRRAPKTYIDGDLRAGLIDPLIALNPDRDLLTDEAFGRPVQFRRARNPHSGFFAVTRSQLKHWMRQPHWLDREVSFVGPLESAATLGVAKTFPVYKPWGASSGYLELRHLDSRFAGLTLPETGQPIGG